MANTQALCSQAKVDFMLGRHVLGTDQLKCALYLVSASRGAGDTVYTVTGEVSGTNYTAGGVNVTSGQVPQLDSTTAHFTPSAPIVFSNVTLAVAFDACIIYNDAGATKYQISVHTFGSQTVTAGDFTLTMPTDDGTTGLIRIA